MVCFLGVLNALSAKRDIKTLDLHVSLGEASEYDDPFERDLDASDRDIICIGDDAFRKASNGGDVLATENNIIDTKILTKKIISIIVNNPELNKISLSLYSAGIGGHNFRKIIDALKNKFVYEIDLSCNKIDNEDVAYLIENLPEELKILSLGRNNISEESIRILLDRLRVSNIEELNLNYSDLPNDLLSYNQNLDRNDRPPIRLHI